MFEVLIKSPLFRSVSEAEMMEMLTQVHYSVKKFEKGSMIAQRDSRIENLMIIVGGSVRGEMIDFSGKLIKIEDMEAPQPIAMAFLFSTHSTFPVDVIANNQASLLYIPKPDVVTLLQTNQKFLLNFLTSISNRSQFLTQKLWFLSFKTIRGKLAHYLLAQAKPDQKSFVLNKTQQELADFFGVTRPSLARVIGEMQDEGIIRVETKTITILNRQKLIELLN